MTTVLGLAPLLYERSVDAQFLKPTVVTLAYGLGFGMVIVLVLVPAIVAMQLDVGRGLSAMRRALGAPRRAGVAGGAVVAASVGAIALLVATLGQVVINGALPAALGGGGLASALGLYVAGVLVVFVLVYIASALTMWRARTR